MHEPRIMPTSFAYSLVLQPSVVIASLMRFAVLLFAVLAVCPACAQDTAEPSVDAAPQPSCSVATDLTCAVSGLEPRVSIGLADSLLRRHQEGELDLERLTRTHLSLLRETASGLLLSGTLLAIEEAAPEVVAGHRAAFPEPSNPAERSKYVRSLLDAFVAADVDLSDRPRPTPVEMAEEIQVFEIGPDSP